MRKTDATTAKLARIMTLNRTAGFLVDAFAPALFFFLESPMGLPSYPYLPTVSFVKMAMCYVRHKRA
jgi:hypothetical protein